MRAMELASLQGHHAGLTPSKWKSADKQPSEHHPGLPAPENHDARHAQQKPAKAAGDLWKRLMAASPHQSHRNDGHRQKHEGFGC